MKILPVVLFFVWAPLASAQAQKVRPATEADFIGYWRVVMIPDEVHKSRFKNDQLGYGGPCRFLIHRADGARFDISVDNMAGTEETVRRCPTRKSDVDPHLFAASAGKVRYRWSKLRDGLFFAKDTAVTDPKAISAYLWKADYVLEDVPASPTFAFDFKKGEMIMQVMQQLPDRTLAPVWPMILRPVAD